LRSACGARVPSQRAAASLINACDVLHIAQAFFAIGFGFFAGQNAFAEMVGFANELGRVFGGISLINGRFAFDLRL